MIDPPDLYPLPVGTSIYGRYRPVAEPLRGGFAFVYKAVDEGNGSVSNSYFALKTPRPDRDPDGKFLREEHHKLQQCGSIHNVVDTYGYLSRNDSGVGLEFMVMQWIEGKSLDTWYKHIDMHSVDDLERCLQIASSVAKTIAHVHKEEVLHGDINPRNILINIDTTPILIDFNIARQPLLESEGAGELFGTVPYMAPEIFRTEREAISFACDIWSLGATVYFLLTGKHYAQSFADFDQRYARDGGTKSRSRLLSDHRSEIHDLLRNTPYQPVSLHLPSTMLTGLNTLLQSMLTHEPADRPNAQEVSARFDELFRDTVAYKQNQRRQGTQTIELSVLAVENNGNVAIKQVPFVRTEAEIAHETWTVSGLLAVSNTDRLLIVPHVDGEERSVYLLERDPVSASKQIDCSVICYASGEFELLHVPGYRMVSDPRETEQSSNRFRELQYASDSLRCSRDGEIHVSLIIDGALSLAWFEEIDRLLEHLFEPILSTKHELFISVIFYDDYDHPSQPRRRAFSESIRLFEPDVDLNEAAAFIRAEKQASSPRNPKRGFSGAVEAAFDQAKTWMQDAPADAEKIIVMVGSAPPHPNHTERYEYELLETTVEEYGEKFGFAHWRQAVEQLKETTKLWGLYIPVQTSERAPRQQELYSRGFFAALNHNNQSFDLSEESKRRFLRMWRHSIEALNPSLLNIEPRQFACLPVLVQEAL